MAFSIILTISNAAPSAHLTLFLTFFSFPLGANDVVNPSLPTGSFFLPIELSAAWNGLLGSTAVGETSGFFSFLKDGRAAREGAAFFAAGAAAEVDAFDSGLTTTLAFFFAPVTPNGRSQRRRGERE